VSAVKKKGVAFNVGQRLKLDQIIRPVVSRLPPQASRFVPTGWSTAIISLFLTHRNILKFHFQGPLWKTTLLWSYIASNQVSFSSTFLPQKGLCPIQTSEKDNGFMQRGMNTTPLTGTRTSHFSTSHNQKQRMADRRTCEAWGTLNFRVKGKVHPRRGHEGP